MTKTALLASSFMLLILIYFMYTLFGQRAATFSSNVLGGSNGGGNDVGIPSATKVIPSYTTSSLVSSTLPSPLPSSPMKRNGMEKENGEGRKSKEGVKETIITSSTDTPIVGSGTPYPSTTASSREVFLEASSTSTATQLPSLGTATTTLSPNQKEKGGNHEEKETDATRIASTLFNLTIETDRCPAACKAFLTAAVPGAEDPKVTQWKKSGLGFVQSSQWLFPDKADSCRTCQVLGPCVSSVKGAQEKGDIVRATLKGVGVSPTDGNLQPIGGKKKNEHVHMEDSWLLSNAEYRNGMTDGVTRRWPSLRSSNYEHVENVCIDVSGGFSGYQANFTGIGDSGNVIPNAYTVNEESGFHFTHSFRRLATPASCYHNVTAFVWLWNPETDVLCCNLAHLLSKVQAMQSLQQRYRHLWEGSPGGQPLNIFNYFRRGLVEKKPKAHTLLQFLLPLMGDNWISVYDFWGREKFGMGGKSQGSGKIEPPRHKYLKRQRICIRHLILGYDYRWRHQAVRYPWQVKWSDRLRQQLHRLSSNTAQGESIAMRFREDHEKKRMEILSDRRNNTDTSTPPNISPAAHWRVSYLSRKSVGRRVLKNRETILGAAKKEFRSIFDLREVSFDKNIPARAQAAEMANTDVLIGPHGQGLTWAFMMPPGSVLIELSNYYRFGWHAGINLNCASDYGSLASRFRIHHVLYFAPANKKLGSRNEKLSIDEADFLELLQVAKCLLELDPKGEGRKSGGTSCDFSRVVCPKCVKGKEEEKQISRHFNCSHCDKYCISTSLDPLAIEPPPSL